MLPPPPCHSYQSEGYARHVDANANTRIRTCIFTNFLPTTYSDIAKVRIRLNNKSEWKCTQPSAMSVSAIDRSDPGQSGNDTSEDAADEGDAERSSSACEVGRLLVVATLVIAALVVTALVIAVLVIAALVVAALVVAVAVAAVA